MVKGEGQGRLATNLTTRQHQFIAGISAKLGGHDEGPDPHEYLEAALAACTVLTVEMYAKRKGWPLASMEAAVKIESEGEEALISRRLVFRGSLDEEQRQRLLEIANKCPIHRLLSRPIKITTTLES